jgi:hypothetical protein
VKHRTRAARHRTTRSLPRRRRRLLVAVTAGALAASGTAALASGLDQPARHPAPVPAAALDLTRTDDGRVSRDRDRSAPSVSPSGSASASLSQTPTRPTPVAGLDQAQMDNAALIVGVAAKRGLPKRAMVVAIVTVMQESNLYNIANPAVPESLSFPHQGASADHDSVGLFQQRPSQGWGSVGQLMDPGYAAGLFYDRLVQVPGWESMAVTYAAQAVQRSGFPYAYQQHESRAQQIVDTLT